MKRVILILAVLVTLLLVTVVLAAPGGLLGTVTLPGNGSCSVGGTFDGTYYMTVEHAPSCASTTLQIYLPPAGGNGAATLVATKNIDDGGGIGVTISALAWDPGRGKVWAAYNDNIYLIDIGDPTVGGNATATWQFKAHRGGYSLVDGLAYDPGDDTLYYSPDVNSNVYHFSPTGTLLNTVTPKNAAGQADGRVSGVVVGTVNTLYIGRDGAAEIRRIDKTSGDFIAQFATTSGRVEDLTCDPVTYAPLEAVLAKDAYQGLYEAFEVEPGTCPLVGGDVEVPVDIKPGSCPNPIQTRDRGVISVAIVGTDLYDVTQIDPATVRLNDVPPLRWSYEDAAIPYEPFLGKEDAYDCDEYWPDENGVFDGITDLVFKFKAQEFIADLGGVQAGDVIIVLLTGTEFGGRQIIGEDVILILDG